ncbi:type IA DNA topoisomerase [Bacillus sp. Au-Bac7]|uniref:type IA DNA topoisomerase n=1 Tax=Bacillus sp. Au-Bac7 TaxID=2906458 RepID=UPI001E479D94|nr:type IA DNA topoisomerase [Bacillus sp. Au-Bac7]MCE4051665.1 DNA topoisomerase [Bacillus sp. Au-Bac7]
MKTLIIAEKPKVAHALLQLSRLRGSQKVEGSMPYYGYYENEEYIVSWCRGHLLEVMNPEEHDEKYRLFNIEHLPIFLDLKYKPVKASEEQLEILVQLLRRNDVDHVINACDADKEGELIFREVFLEANVQKRLSRIFKSSHEKEELEVAFNQLLPGEDFESLWHAAKARQYLDHLLGITITRGSTSKLANNQFLLASGRVQIVLLQEIYKREQEIKQFKEGNFYHLLLDLENKLQVQLKTENQQLDPKPLLDMGNRLKGSKVTITSFEEKNKKANPKHLYNLSDIYKEAESKFKVGAMEVKKHIQTLYDEGFITYPRSDSRHLPTSRVGNVLDAIDTLQLNPAYTKFMSMVEREKITSKHKAFNDELVTSHYAITPTSKRYAEEGKAPLEKDLYDMIVQRFLGVFMPSATFLVRKLVAEDELGNEYVASEKILVDPGFLACFKEEMEDDVQKEFTIPSLHNGDSFIIDSFSLKEGKMRRPSLYTEASLLTFMENAGKHIDDVNLKELMKGKRIGTPATVETFIPKLVGRKYIQMDGKGRLTTTETGAKFITVFPFEKIKNPAFTAELEGEIESIIRKELSFDDLKQKTDTLAIDIVKELKQVPPHVTASFVKEWNKQIEIFTCRCKKGKMVDKGRFYACSNYPQCKETIPKVIKGKELSETQLKKLMETGETDQIKGFKNEENTFDAVIYFAENGQLKMKKFVFAQCPKCQDGDIIKRDGNKEKVFFSCSNYKNGCTFSLPAMIKEKKIPDSQIKKLLTKKSTDFISGFVSDQGKEFTARIILKPDFSLQMAFPTIDDRTLGKCPLCGERVLVGKQYYLCEKYKDTCDFILSPSILGKKIPSSQIAKLLDKNITDTIKGFKKKDKEGETFDAKLSYDKENKRVAFVFEKKKGFPKKTS